MSDDLLISRPAAFERGLNGDDIKRRVARGEWRVVRRGLYVRATSLAGLDAGVVAADDALRRGLLRTDELRSAVARATRRSGVRTAHQVAAFADPGAESVGESRSRILIDRAGLPRPQLQFEVRDRRGAVARTDFGWPQFRTVGEFDGKATYSRGLPRGRNEADAVFAEKVREDRIRDLGWQVVRWTQSPELARAPKGTAELVSPPLRDKLLAELDEPLTLAVKIRQALARGRAQAA